MASGLFASYEEDFCEKARQVRHALAMTRALEGPLERSDGLHQAISETGTVSPAQRFQAAEQGITHLRDLLMSMSYESNDIALVAAKEEAKCRVAEYRQILQGLEKEASRVQQDANGASTADLLPNDGGGSAVTLNDATQKAYTHMLDNTKKLSCGTTTLHKAEALVHSAYDAGTSTLSNLRTQTETIQHFHTVIHDVDAELMESRRLVNRMQQTAVRHRLCLIGIIVGLLLAVVGVFALR